VEIVLLDEMFCEKRSPVKPFVTDMTAVAWSFRMDL